MLYFYLVEEYLEWRMLELCLYPVDRLADNRYLDNSVESAPNRLPTTMK